MAITPAQARQNREGHATAEQLKTATDQIDHYLSTTPPTQEDVYAEWYFKVRGWPKGLIDALTRDYEAAGWRVRQSPPLLPPCLIFCEGTES